MMYDKIIKFLLENSRVLGILGFFYLSGWFLNALYGTKFDLPEMRQFFIALYGIVSAKQAAVHFTNSKLNSPQDEFPKNDTKM